MTETIFNLPLERSRVQSSLGKKMTTVDADGEVTKLVIGKVKKVNFDYNTVDVLVKGKNIYSDMFMGDNKRKGVLSARIPVTFGGSLSNGMTYGETIPITVDDMVLLGFVDGRTTTPIVINIYKSDVTSRDLRPVPMDSSLFQGNPENPKLLDKYMALNKVYPSQTIDNVSGEGHIERTFTGKAFITTSTKKEAQTELNDHLYGFESLSGVWRSDGTLREPIHMVPPTILAQIPWRGITSNKTNFFHKDGLTRVSNLDFGNNTATYLTLNRSGDLHLTHQEGDTQQESVEEGVKKAVVGLVKGIPTMLFDNVEVLVTDKGLTINGTTVTELITSATLELEKEITRLQQVIKGILAITDNIDLEELARVSMTVTELTKDMAQAQKDLVDVADNIASLETAFTEFEIDFLPWRRGVDTSIESLFLEIANARGQFPTMSGRLDAMDSAFQSINATLIDLTNDIEELQLKDIEIDTRIDNVVRTIVPQETTTSTVGTVRKVVTTQGKLVVLALHGTLLGESPSVVLSGNEAPAEIKEFIIPVVADSVREVVTLQLSGSTATLLGIDKTKTYTLNVTVTYQRREG